MHLYKQIARSMSAFAVVLVAAMLCADDQPSQPDDRAPVTRLKLYPAAEPRPALRYRLLPSSIDLRPGNAAVFYNKAELMLCQQGDAEKDARKAGDWLDVPLEVFPRAEVAQAAHGWEEVLRQVGYATLRQECDWQLPLREQNPYTVSLADVQQLRTFARMLAAKCRLAIVEARYDDAVAALRTGYALARHAACGPTFVHAAIGMAIANVMTEQARDLARQPAAPNLYWAFSGLPRPFIALDLANDYEHESLYYWHPEWRDMESQQHSPAEWHQIYLSLVDSLTELDAERFGEWRQLQILGRAVKGYARAKRWLVDRGRRAEAVETMSVAQVVVLYTLGVYDESCDELFKWATLPPWYAEAKFPDAVQLFEREERRGIIPLAELQLPSLRAFMQSYARTERAFALARVIEALRLYAAGHGGKVPKQLSDVADILIPNDPWTGKPFDYHVSDGVATLAARPPADMPAKYFGVHYEITIGQPPASW